MSPEGWQDVSLLVQWYICQAASLLFQATTNQEESVTLPGRVLSGIAGLRLDCAHIGTHPLHGCIKQLMSFHLGVS